MSAISEDHLAPRRYLRLEGKVAIVTGGVSGIGKSIVELFLSHGAKVCIGDILDDEAQNLCNALSAYGNNVTFIHCDVTIESDVSAAVDHAVQKYGTLDIIVNNAGILGCQYKDIREVDMSDFQHVFDINTKGVFHGMKHASKVMIPNQKGSIVSISSVASQLGGIGPHAYTASKHAVVGLTKSVAAELGNHGIRINCVSPFAVPTKLTSSMVEKGREMFWKKKGNLQGAKASTTDVAEAVLYLASDESRYVSGMNLVVDGGFTAVNHSLQFFRNES